MSIIDSLSAGYRFVTGRLHLLLLPIALDLVLWGTPRLSIGPLLDKVAEIYQNAAQMDGLTTDLSSVAQQASELLVEWGQQSNLLNLIANGFLFHVPSVMAIAEPLPNVAIREISNPVAVVALFLLLALVGLFLGVVYFGLLADRLPIGAGARSRDWTEFLILSLHRWAKTVLLVIVVILGFIAVLVPVTLGATLIALLSPPIASLLMALMSGLAFVALFYLYFSTAGLVTDDLTIMNAISRSVQLVRNSFWSTFGFIILINLISLGFSLIWVALTSYVPAGTIVAIVGNAYIGTGLAMALIIFYRTRTIMMDGNSTLEEILEQV